MGSTSSQTASFQAAAKMTRIHLARYQLEIRGEKTYNYLRFFLIAIFAAATAIAYSDGLINQTNLVFFIGGIGAFVFTLSVSALLLRLRRYHPYWKYIALFLEFTGFLLVNISYVYAQEAQWVTPLRGRNLYAIYYLILAGSTLRFQPLFCLITGGVSVAVQITIFAVLMNSLPLELVSGTANTSPRAVSISEAAISIFFLIVTAVVLAAAAAYIRELLLKAQSSEDDAESRLGDLSTLMHETKRIAGDLDDMVDELGDVTVANEDLGRDQMASIEETSATMEQMSASTRSIADKAKVQDELCDQNEASMRELDGLVEDIAGVSKDATMRAGSTIELAERGEKELSNAVRLIESIQESSNRVADSVTVINDIAEKTNLLALNAAIEAARAGEEGRGFSVVADEVGKLAELSSRNAREIERMIRETQEVTENGVTSTSSTLTAIQSIIAGIKDIAELIGRSDRMVSRQTEASKKVLSQTSRIQSMARDMRDATTEQLNGAREILNAIDSINSSSEKYVQSSEQLRRTAETLSDASKRLTARISDANETAEGDAGTGT